MTKTTQFYPIRIIIKIQKINILYFERIKSTLHKTKISKLLFESNLDIYDYADE